jgi:hypothetical protein
MRTIKTDYAYIRAVLEVGDFQFDCLFNGIPFLCKLVYSHSLLTQRLLNFVGAASRNLDGAKGRESVMSHSGKQIYHLVEVG